jgi:hypothetical protein
VLHRGRADVADRLVLTVGVAAAAREEAQEVGLARAVAAEDPDPLAEPDLRVERLHEPVPVDAQLEIGGDDGALGRAAPGEPHRDLLAEGHSLRGAGVLEPAQPGLGGLEAGGHVRVVGRLLPVHDDEGLDLGMLLVPAPEQLLEPLVAVDARLLVRREGPGVDPDRVAAAALLEGGEACRDPVEQLAVVTDEQHGLGRVEEPLLEPALGGHVEVVVGLVEHEHLVGTPEQGLENDPLLLAPGQRRHLAPLGPLEGRPEGRHGADVPEGLPLVTADVPPVGEGLRVVELVLLGVALHHRELGALDLDGRSSDRLGGDGHEEVAHRGVVAHLADELPHDAEPAAAGDRAVGCREVARQDAQQRRLAGAVRADEGDLGTLAHPEGDVAEQAPPVRQDEAHGVDVEVAHGGRV